MKFIVSLLFFTLSIFMCLNAQKGEIVPGYIVDNNGQKIEGFIQVQKPVDCEVKIKFSEKEKVKKYPLYKPKDLSAYGFEATGFNNMKEPFIYWRHFVKYELDRPAKIFASNISMVEKTVEGYFSAYLFEYDTGSDVENPITKRYIVMHENEELCQIEEDNFEEASKSLFEGYTSLVKSIGKVKFRFHNFVRLVEDYNYWIEVQHDPNTYKMNPKIFKQ